MILIIPLTNIEQGKTILNKEQGIMNKEVVQGQSAYTSKFNIPCSIFNEFSIHLDVLFFWAVSILLTKIEIS